MDTRRLLQFITSLMKAGAVYAPVRQNGELIVRPLAEADEAVLGNDVPMTTFKPVFLPHRQVIFDYQDGQLHTKSKPPEFRSGLGLTLPDLKAFAFFERVFQADPAYQAQRQQNLIVGYAEAKDAETLVGPLERPLPRTALEHLVFDVFLARTGAGRFRVYTGSPKGRAALRRIRYSDSVTVTFRGFETEAESPWFLKYREAILKSHAKPVWTYWGDRCLACGKCAVDCPMCFCFNLDDEPDGEKPNSGQRVRHWTTCFFNDFSAFGLGQQFLKTNTDRIENWYVHKFLRIPRQYDLTGCVDCGRCDQVCPAGIIRRDVLKSLEQPEVVPPADLKSPNPNRQTET